MYASDDTTSAVADRLLPISPAVMSETDGRQQQQQQQPVVDYSSVAAMYMAPPPYAMYAPAAPAPVAADVPQYAVYPAGYGAGEPQYVQFGVAPSQVKF